MDIYRSASSVTVIVVVCYAITRTVVSAIWTQSGCTVMITTMVWCIRIKMEVKRDGVIISDVHVKERDLRRIIGDTNYDNYYWWCCTHQPSVIEYMMKPTGMKPMGVSEDSVQEWLVLAANYDSHMDMWVDVKRIIAYYYFAASLVNSRLRHCTVFVNDQLTLSDVSIHTLITRAAKQVLSVDNTHPDHVNATQRWHTLAALLQHRVYL